MPHQSAFPPVLLVDDDEAIRVVARLVLTEADYPVFEAEDGAATLLMLHASAHPMIVLLDRCMPGMDGERLLAAVAADETLATRHAYVLMTALPPAGASPLGALLTQLQALVLPKPFEIDTLVATVAQAADRLLATVEQPVAPEQPEQP